jgi:hypothetical protein
MRPKRPSECNEVKWDTMYKELEAYHKKHGHSSVPSTLKDKLSYWVVQQRGDRRTKQARMTAERIARLDKLDFKWGRLKVAANSQRNDERWLEMYKKLKAYHEKHGHCKVTIQSNELGGWVSQQRIARKSMPQNRKDMLDELDFVWFVDNWDVMYKQLVKFRQEHGHIEIPTRCVENRSLGEWCRKQRGHMRQNKLPPERRGRMEEINFDFELQSEKNERIWNEKFRSLKKYKLEHGDCLVPSRKDSKKAVSDPKLSSWVRHQREHYKSGTIPNHRMQQLEEVEFVWSIVDRGSQSTTEKQNLLWEKSYEKLRKFHEVHGHFTVPTVLENGKINPLSSWITTQRKHDAQYPLKEDRRLKLEAIDFIWTEGIKHQSERLWYAVFHELTKFREEKGHTFVRRDDGMTLWRWTEKMNWKRTRGTLSSEREERLESIGFWDPPPQGYQQRGENNGKCKEEDDDDRKPTAKRRRTTSTEELCLSEDDDDRKPRAKRRRIVLRQPKLQKNMKRRQSSAEVFPQETLSGLR